MVELLSRRKPRRSPPPERLRVLGYCCVYGVELDHPDFAKCAAGCFADFVAQVQAGRRHVVCLLDHDPDCRLASTRDDTLRLWEDSWGVGCEILVDTADRWGRVALRRLEGDRPAGMSLGYVATQYRREETTGKKVLTAGWFDEVSILSNPANPATVALCPDRLPWWYPPASADSSALLVQSADRLARLFLIFRTRGADGPCHG